MGKSRAPVHHTIFSGLFASWIASAGAYGFARLRCPECGFERLTKTPSAISCQLSAGQRTTGHDETPLLLLLKAES
jgi:hypothetical protein